MVVMVVMFPPFARTKIRIFIRDLIKTSPPSPPSPPGSGVANEGDTRRGAHAAHNPEDRKSAPGWHEFFHLAPCARTRENAGRRRLGGLHGLHHRRRAVAAKSP